MSVKIQCGTDYIEASGDPEWERWIVKKWKVMRHSFYRRLEQESKQRWAEKESILLNIGILERKLKDLKP